MTNQRIIYPTPEGGVAVVIPSGEISIEEVAAKDVPAGVEYKIVDVSEIPSDRTFRNAWEYQS
jgi:ribosomal protein S12